MYNYGPYSYGLYNYGLHRYGLFIRCFLKAAEGGSRDAQYQMALCYFEGMGVEVPEVVLAPSSADTK